MYTERALSKAAPVEYLECVPFDEGVFFVAPTAFVRYLARTDKTETHKLAMNLGDKGKLFHAVADKRGESVLLVFQNEQLLFSWAEKKVCTSPAIAPPVFVALEENKAVFFMYNAIHVVDLGSMLAGAPRATVYAITPDVRLGDPNAIVFYPKRVILGGTRVVEMEYVDVLAETVVPNEKHTLYELEVALASIDKKIRVKNFVLIKPEPVTFASEQITKEVFTEWGMVTAYETGIEVYQHKNQGYYLAYVYKCSPELVQGRATLGPKARVFLKDKKTLVEVLPTAPVKIAEVDEDARVYALGAHLLTLSNKNTLISTRPKEVAIPAPDTPRTLPVQEITIQKTLTQTANECLTWLNRYKNLDLSLLKGKTEEEHGIILEKILNAFKADVTDRVLVLALSLKEKLIYLQETVEALTQQQQDLLSKTSALATRNNAILRKTSRLFSSIKETYAAIATQPTPFTASEAQEIEALREEVAELSETIKITPSLQRREAILEGRLAFLKHQNIFLRKKIKDIDTD
ncbi:hypothetical protein NEDG_01141 [Nematocida displodere]|uniref:Uncharacterized protein n=1 Tax=Nematocida displodere TaxID=1805483 RepID=A0A177ECW2_9MICR|nr:hypothetical protein NEDG_01141 [Nematocida displodere]